MRALSYMIALVFVLTGDQLTAATMIDRGADRLN